jgi:hypothetical protein
VYVLVPINDKVNFEINNINFINFGSTERSLSPIKLFFQILELRKILISLSIKKDDIIFSYSPKLILLNSLSIIGIPCITIPVFIGLGSLYINRRYFILKIIFGYLIQFNKSIKKIIALNPADIAILKKNINNKPILLLKGEGIDINFYKYKV